MIDNKLLDVNTGVQHEELLTVTDNLIDITNDLITQNNAPNDNGNTVNNLTPDMIDLNSNPSSEPDLLKTTDNHCDSPTKKLIADIGNRLFETILEPILNPIDTSILDNANDFGFTDKSTNNYVTQTNENIPQLDNRNIGLKKEDNFNCSTNSLVSENLSSPMQTSTDNMIDSELASNDSHSPKSTQNLNSGSNVSSDAQQNQPINFHYGHRLLEVKKFNEFCSSYDKPKLYSSNETFSNPKSDQSLLNSAESCDSSPVHKVNKDYIPRKQSKKLKSKKTFGVKTLQAIFSKNDGYSDISSTNSDFGDESYSLNDSKVELEPVSTQIQMPIMDTIPTTHVTESKQSIPTPATVSQETVHKFEEPSLFNPELTHFLSKPILTEVTPQFEQNIHTFLSDTFDKKPKSVNAEVSLPNFSVSNIGNKKYFMFNGQNVRVGKALRLCPNEDIIDKNLSGENLSAEQKLAQREKLLARYVYNSHSINVDGIGDPDFGTPV